ncbi:hypothetical protein [Amycolatopsis sp.]|uniref:hypothetical protein n=1 Tax=Amycolatopsis sp. TaxID=37632 RepID=UPI0039C8AB39
MHRAVAPGGGEPAWTGLGTQFPSLFTYSSGPQEEALRVAAEGAVPAFGAGAGGGAMLIFGAVVTGGAPMVAAV